MNPDHFLLTIFRCLSDETRPRSIMQCSLTRDDANGPFARRQRRSTSPCEGWRVGVLCALFICFAPIGSAYSKGKPFEVRSAESRLHQGVWFATALIDFRLSEDALAALDNGVILTFELQIRLDRVRRFWIDRETAVLEQSFELSYQPLSERYVVRNLNSGEQDSFATLFSALNSMGRIVDLPIIDASLLDAEEQYEIAIRAVLDQNTLPGPLRLLAFWSSGFRLESDWYVWMLNV